MTTKKESLVRETTSLQWESAEEGAEMFDPEMESDVLLSFDNVIEVKEKSHASFAPLDLNSMFSIDWSAIRQLEEKNPAFRNPAAINILKTMVNIFHYPQHDVVRAILAGCSSVFQSLKFLRGDALNLPQLTGAGLIIDDDALIPLATGMVKLGWSQDGVVDAIVFNSCSTREQICEFLKFSSTSSSYISTFALEPNQSGNELSILGKSAPPEGDILRLQARHEISSSKEVTPTAARTFQSDLDDHFLRWEESNSAKAVVRISTSSNHLPPLCTGNLSRDLYFNSDLILSDDGASTEASQGASPSSVSQCSSLSHTSPLRAYATEISPTAATSSVFRSPSNSEPDDSSEWTEFMSHNSEGARQEALFDGGDNPFGSMKLTSSSSGRGSFLDFTAAEVSTSSQTNSHRVSSSESWSGFMRCQSDTGRSEIKLFGEARHPDSGGARDSSAEQSRRTAVSNTDDCLEIEDCEDFSAAYDQGRDSDSDGEKNSLITNYSTTKSSKSTDDGAERKGCNNPVNFGGTGNSGPLQATAAKQEDIFIRSPTREMKSAPFWEPPKSSALTFSQAQADSKTAALSSYRGTSTTTSTAASSATSTPVSSSIAGSIAGSMSAKSAASTSSMDIYAAVTQERPLQPSKQLEPASSFSASPLNLSEWPSQAPLPPAPEYFQVPPPAPAAYSLAYSKKSSKPSLSYSPFGSSLPAAASQGAGSAKAAAGATLLQGAGAKAAAGATLLQGAGAVAWAHPKEAAVQSSRRDSSTSGHSDEAPGGQRSQRMDHAPKDSGSDDISASKESESVSIRSELFSAIKTSSPATIASPLKPSGAKLAPSKLLTGKVGGATVTASSASSTTTAATKNSLSGIEAIGDFCFSTPSFTASSAPTLTKAAPKPMPIPPQAVVDASMNSLPWQGDDGFLSLDTPLDGRLGVGGGELLQREKREQRNLHVQQLCAVLSVSRDTASQLMQRCSTVEAAMDYYFANIHLFASDEAAQPAGGFSEDFNGFDRVSAEHDFASTFEPAWGPFEGGSLSHSATIPATTVMATATAASSSSSLPPSYFYASGRQAGGLTESSDHANSLGLFSGRSSASGGHMDMSKDTRGPQKDVDGPPGLAANPNWGDAFAQYDELEHTGTFRRSRTGGPLAKAASRPGSDLGSKAGSELGSRPGSELGSKVGSELGSGLGFGLGSDLGSSFGSSFGFGPGFGFESEPKQDETFADLKPAAVHQPPLIQLTEEPVDHYYRRSRTEAPAPVYHQQQPLLQQSSSNSSRAQTSAMDAATIDQLMAILDVSACMAVKLMERNDSVEAATDYYFNHQTILDKEIQEEAWASAAEAAAEAADDAFDDLKFDFTSHTSHTTYISHTPVVPVSAAMQKPKPKQTKKIDDAMVTRGTSGIVGGTAASAVEVRNGVEFALLDLETASASTPVYDDYPKPHHSASSNHDCGIGTSESGGSSSTAQQLRLEELQRIVEEQAQQLAAAQDALATERARREQADRAHAHTRMELLRTQHEARELHCAVEGEAASLRSLDELLSCPLSLEMMVDPVITPQGLTFDRQGLLTWLATGGKCPMTNRPLRKQDLRDNILARSIIELRKPGGAATGAVQPPQSSSAALATAAMQAKPSSKPARSRAAMAGALAVSFLDPFDELG